MAVYDPNYRPPSPEPPPSKPDGFVRPPPELQHSDNGAIAPPLGDVVRDQLTGIGRYSRGLVPKSFNLAVAKDANNPKHESVLGNVLQVLAAQGGAIPDDARISIGGSEFFPLIEGMVYETDQPFDGYDLYWPTAAAGVIVWVLVAFGRANRRDANDLLPVR